MSKRASIRNRLTDTIKASSAHAKWEWTIYDTGVPHLIQVYRDEFTYGKEEDSLSIDGKVVARYWNVDGALQQFFNSSGINYLPTFENIEWNGHVISVRSSGMLLSFPYLALFVDGNEFTDAMGEPPLIFKQEVDVLDSEQLVGVEEYPLHNTYGDVAYTIDRQISKSSTNEISIEVASQKNLKINTELLTALKGEVAWQLTKTLGCKVDETVTETQTLHLSAGARASVLYRVLWKRKVRTGKRVYTVGNEEIEIPYQLFYGLACEIRSEDLKPENSQP